MGCSESLAALQHIDQNIAAMLYNQTKSDEWTGYYQGWTATRKNKSWFFRKTVTFAGTSNTENIDMSVPFQINRIEQVFNDATARDYSVRVITEPSSTAYIALDEQTVNTDLNTYLQAGIEYKYPANARIQLYWTTFTAGKTVVVNVQVDEV